MIRIPTALVMGAGLLLPTVSPAAEPARALVPVAGGGSIETLCYGAGPTIVMLPSAARGAEDFAEVAGELAQRGFRVLLPEPRGAGRSTAPGDDVTLAGMADDVAGVIRAQGGTPVILVGHAFGGFVARMMAMRNPELIRGLVLAAHYSTQQIYAQQKQGQRDSAVANTLRLIQDQTAPEAERLTALHQLFFDDGHDARLWLQGWWPKAGAGGARAMMRAPPPEQWAAGGAGPVLEIVAGDDPLRPATSLGDEATALGKDRVTSVLIRGARHALMPEKPAEVAGAIAGWARRLPGPAPRAKCSTPAGAGKEMPMSQKTFSRVPLPALADMNAAQRAAYDQAVAFFGAPTGPRLVMIDTPEVAAAWNNLLGALTKSSLPKPLWELAILTVARAWDSQFEWWAHEPLALKAGLTPEVVAAIRDGRAPNFIHDDQAAIYAYATELMRDHRVSDATYNRLRDLIGSRQLVELTVLMGHYTNVAMTLAAHDVQLPPGVKPPLAVRR